MSYFVKNININKLLHLHNFTIETHQKSPHLLITGKNGTGKTILLNAVADFFDIMFGEDCTRLCHYFKQLDYWRGKHQAHNDPNHNYEIALQQINNLFDKVWLEFVDFEDLIEQYKNKNFIISFYGAGRLAKMQEPKNPTKPNLQTTGGSSSSLTNQFLFFLSDLKIQEALARNEQQYTDADNIKSWFEGFEGILKEIYDDKELKLEFNYKDYSFLIVTNGKKFKFTEMSDGFIAAIDIIADLILKMQDGDTLIRNYQKEGLVLIDEIETHLHLELQRTVMPLLTKVFPKIQFIVTTHSPFVLSSMPNAIAYDLEHREAINDLTEYSYEALAEGYFGVKTESSYIEMRLGSLRDLLEKEELSNGEAEQLLALIKDFEQIPEAVSPTLIGEFMRLKVEFSDKVNALKKS
jgi:predicted ATP-binding protein involved in virulence